MLVADRIAGPRAYRRWTLTSWLPVAALAALTLVVRLVRLRAPASPDEAGFLLVARQWDGRGTSLYTNYWVDRPPLLLLVFRAADAWGGLGALRVIGGVAALVTVVAVAWTADVLDGPRARLWAAVVAAALMVSPLTGAREVDGELLAAPFIALGIGCAAHAVVHSAASRRWAAAAGALGTAAPLIKQNMVDVAVFATVFLLLAFVRRDIGRRHAVHLVGAAVAGALGLTATVAILTMLRGTSLSGVWFAMYPFRIAAGKVVAAHGSVHAQVRLGTVMKAALLSGLVAVPALAAVELIRRGREVDAALVSLLAVLCFDAVSVYAGACYWLHYLVQPVPVAAICLGLLGARGAPGARALVVYVAAVSLLAVSFHPRVAPVGSAQVLGESVAAAARTDDTIVVLYGHPDVVFASGLASPYPQLWSLPVRTLDPHLDDLSRVLTSRNGPTWLVDWSGLDSWGLDTAHAQRVIDRGYRPAGRVCGHDVLLRRGVDRPPLPRPTAC